MHFTCVSPPPYAVLLQVSRRRSFGSRGFWEFQIGRAEGGGMTGAMLLLLPGISGVLLSPCALNQEPPNFFGSIESSADRVRGVDVCSTPTNSLLLAATSCSVLCFIPWNFLTRRKCWILCRRRCCHSLPVVLMLVLVSTCSLKSSIVGRVTQRGHPQILVELVTPQFLPRIGRF